MVDKSRIANSILDDAAVRSETVISYGRITIISLMLVRFLMHEPSATELASATLAALVGIGFSVAYLVLRDRSKPNTYWLWLSTIIDVITAFLVTFNNPLYPDVDYRGVLHIPDTVVLPILIFVCGFRLSIPIALFGGIAHSMSLLLIVYLETSYLQVAEYSSSTIIMWLIITGAATLAAVISAMRTRSLCALAANESLRLEQTKDGVRALLQSHHDAHSILTSVNINAERLIESAVKPSPEFTKITEDLKSDLSVINSCIEQIKHDSDTEIRLSSELKIVDINTTIQMLINRLKPPSETASITFAPSQQHIFSSLKGGESTLDRILINLIDNALEGNGTHSAKNITITTELCPNKLVRIKVIDDGPGFSSQPDGVKSSKLKGFGIGLSSITDLVRRNDGTINYERPNLGGTSVVIEFHYTHTG